MDAPSPNPACPTMITSRRPNIMEHIGRGPARGSVGSAGSVSAPGPGSSRHAVARVSCARVRLWVGMVVRFASVIRVSVCPVCPMCVPGTRLPRCLFTGTASSHGVSATGLEWPMWWTPRPPARACSSPGPRCQARRRHTTCSPHVSRRPPVIRCRRAAARCFRRSARHAARCAATRRHCRSRAWTRA